MRKISEKIIAIIMVVLLTINSSMVTVVSTALEMLEGAIQDGRIKAIAEVNVQKYVNYELKDGKGVLLKLDLQTGIEYSENQDYVAIRETKTELQLPQIEGEYPRNVEVLGISTKATNGKESAENIEYDYNEENGIVSILAENKEDQEGNLYTEKIDNARDIYEIDAYYSENCYTAEELEREIVVAGKITEVLADEEGATVEKDIDNTVAVKENVSDLISTNLIADHIYDGNIVANINNRSSNPTQYEENMQINVDYKDISEQLSISEINKFINLKDQEVETQEIKYAAIKINKNEILDILGEDGNFVVENENGEKLVEVNKDTETDELGNINVNYEAEQNSIIVKITTPIKLGKINVINTKVIKPEMLNLENNKIKTTDVIVGINKIIEKDEETEEIINETEEEIYKFENSKENQIENSETRIDLLVDNTNWTNNIENEVNFHLELFSNEFKYNLLKNPTVEIKLPKEVEKIILGDSALLYEYGLKIKEIQTVEENEEKIIRVSLEGTEENYNLNPFISGPNVIIPATIIIKKDITDIDTKIQYTYTNENGNIKDYEKEGKTNKEIGVNIESIFEKDVSVEEQKIIEPMLRTIQPVLSSQIQEDSRITTSVNLYKGIEGLNDGDKIHENEYIAYIIDVKNNSQETINNVKITGNVPEGTIYMEQNVVETLSDEDIDYQCYDKYRERFDDTVTEITKTFNLAGGEEEHIVYYVKAKELENGETEKQITNTIKTYIEDIQIAEYQQTNIIEKADINVSLTAWETEREGNPWAYTINVKNNTNQDISNMKLDLILPNELECDEDEKDDWYTITKIEKGVRVSFNEDVYLEANNNKKIVLYVKAYGKENLTSTYLTTVARASGNNVNMHYSNYHALNIYNVVMEITQSSVKEGKNLEFNEEIEYEFTIKNLSNSNMLQEGQSIHFLDYISEEMQLQSIEYETYVYNEETDKYEKTTMTEDLTLIDEKNTDEENTNILLYVLSGQEVKVKVKAIADLVTEDTVVTNVACIKYEYNGEHTLTSNIIRNKIKNYYKIEEQEQTNPINPGNNENTKYSISGLAWLDTNKDGQRNSSENKLKGIIVKLFDADTNQIVNINGQNQVVETSENGTYTFNNLSKGNYLVVFQYDTQKYGLTAYQKSEISDSINSDAIEKEVNVDGTAVKVGITDIIKLDKNYSNIDIGLFENDNFDLKLNKSIINVKATYGGKTKENSYNQTKLAKVEIPSKNITGAVVGVTYQIEITNEGNVAGYANEIIDYIPEGFEFDSNANEGWAKTSNGMVKNGNLSGILIKPGESKFVNLYLTKKLTSTSLGTVTNEAEIGNSKSINEKDDVDSKVKNRNKQEDDYSTAELLISIKTGAVLYTGIIVAVLAILIFIKILIDKKIIKIKSIKALSIMLIFTTIMGITIFTKAAVTGDVVEKIISQTESGGYKVILKTDKELKEKEIIDFIIEGYTPSSTRNIRCYATSVGATMEKGHHDFIGLTSGKPFLTVNYITHSRSTSIEGLKKTPYHYNSKTGVKYGDLYCTDGNDMSFNSSNPYIYSYDHIDKENGYKPKLVLEDTDNSGSSDTVSVTDKTDTQVLSIISDSEGNNIFGPWQIAYKGNLKSIKVYYKDETGAEKTTDNYIMIDENGNEIEELASKQNFYIKTNSSIKNISKIKVKVKGEGKTTKRYTLSFREIWLNSNRKNDDQKLARDCKVTIVQKIEKEASAEKTLPGIVPQQIKIKKIDAETGKGLNGVGFKIYCEGGYLQAVNGVITNYNAESYNGTEFTTSTINGEDGVIIIDGVKDDIYMAEETRALDGYYPVNPVYISVEAGKSASVTVENSKKTKPVSIGLVKIDDREGNKPLQNVGFVFRANVLRMIVVGDHYEWRWVERYMNSDLKWNAESKSSAKIFKTGIDGKINVDGASGEETRDLVAIEVSNPYYGYYTGKEYSLGSIHDTKALENHQYKVKLSGFVWLEDEDNAKLGTTDGVYSSGEQGFNGITVYLKDRKGQEQTRTTTTSEQGIYSEITGGEYRFTDVDLDKVQAGDYYIEFEYCGVLYQSVVAQTNIKQGSKAFDTNSRKALDDKFTSVDSTGSQSLNVNRVGLQYSNIDNYSSNVINHYPDYQEQTVNNINNHSGCSVYANTDVAYYNIYDDFETTTEEIRYINLGLFEKAQTDYSLASDLYNVRVDLNQFSHIYKYATARYNEDGSQNEDSSWNMGVKFQNNRGTYQRPIYQSDADYDASRHTDNEIHAYVTYKVALRNESTYAGKINSIVDYCDNRFELVSAGRTIEDKTAKISNNVNYGNKQSYNSEYSKYIIDVNTELNSGETGYIYLQFMMNKEAVRLALNNGDLLNNVTEINSYTTFNDNGNTVAVFDIDSVPGNSIPGNLNTYEDDTDAARSLQLVLVNPREISGTVFVDKPTIDDKTHYKEERKGNGLYDSGEETLKGIVVTMKEVGKESTEYDGERKVYYGITDENGKFKIDGFVAGNYILTYTWGDKDYIIKYYNDATDSSMDEKYKPNKDYKVQEYKSTIYDESRVVENGKSDWYTYEYENSGRENVLKDRVIDGVVDVNFNNGELAHYWWRDQNPEIRRQDAVDSYTIRLNVDNEMEENKYNTLEDAIDKAYNKNDGTMITGMHSSTPVMSFSVEYSTEVTDGTRDEIVYGANNVDFGIVERPRQELDFSKRISGYRLILANGQVLADITIDENGEVKGSQKYLSYIKEPAVNQDASRTYERPREFTSARLRTEMDNELIEGATLETTYTMKATNISEIDYEEPRYYYYGKPDPDGSQVRITVKEVLDYVDGRVSVEDNKWKEKDTQYLKDVNAGGYKLGTKTNKDYSETKYLNSVRTYMSENLDKELTPGQSYTVDLHTSKSLTSTDDNSFDNRSEITKVSKHDDSFNTGRPVKHRENDTIYKTFNIEDAETSIIIPSTGENKDYMTPTIIGIISALIIGIGTFCIKKFIIDKE